MPSPTADTLSLSQARDVLDAQPFSRHLGSRITAFGAGSGPLRA